MSELPDADETAEYHIQIDKWFFGDDEDYRVTIRYTDDEPGDEITSGSGSTIQEAFNKCVGDLKI
jgi:hypothetical protein